MDQTAPDGAVSRQIMRGRPPGFDRENALRAAMRLFWDRGYEGTTFDGLCTAMGISASSLQNSFGSKQDLYQEATRFYLKEKADWFDACLTGRDTARAEFDALIGQVADAFTRTGEPAGCMVSLAGTTSAALACDPIRDMMVEQRGLSERTMARRLQRGIDAGELPPGTDAAALGAYFNTVFRGMAVQARDGATRDRLMQIGQLAMRAWPDPATG